MSEPRVTVDRDGHLLLIGLNRPEKMNAADHRLLSELALAYGELDRDPELRVGVVYAHGEHFTSGLDLADIAPRIGASGLDMVPEGGIHPWGMDGTRVSKPVVLAVQGTCLTLGIELALASDIVVAASDTVFAQLEVARAILPFGGATTRFAAQAGWGNAMRWMLTGDRFDAHEAHRIGIVQEVVEPGTQLERATAIAQTIAAQAPLAVQATLANARLAVAEGETAAATRLPSDLVRLMQTEDARIGVEAFMTRSTPQFIGR
ncbi:enoyl-CoA hydratase/carnithine racemase [Microcella alkaliphila]|uniref:Enoyl-CoA hydratase/carnithine racemase n=1 Tax=Microcella alkaliphila TaxID=279828 RepID=A0A4Q7TGZ1_9MICO|nr:crotonase/enoyl-CoA hydratase family protein [Microcella alkaliphila]RZT59257.1 enoyl-CoA hydratase/carnithine racemase [Microcella alkaliphila]